MKSNSHKQLMEFIDSIQNVQMSALRANHEDIDRLRTRNKELEVTLESIQEIAENNYDGPEDKTLGSIIVECQRALGQMP